MITDSDIVDNLIRLPLFDSIDSGIHRIGRNSRNVHAGLEAAAPSDDDEDSGKVSSVTTHQPPTTTNSYLLVTQRRGTS